MVESWKNTSQSRHGRAVFSLPVLSLGATRNAIFETTVSGARRILTPYWPRGRLTGQEMPRLGLKRSDYRNIERAY